MYLLLGAWGIGPDVQCGSAGLECGIGLGAACCGGWDDTQHFLLNHTYREKRRTDTTINTFTVLKMRHCDQVGLNHNLRKVERRRNTLSDDTKWHGGKMWVKVIEQNAARKREIKYCRCEV